MRTLKAAKGFRLKRSSLYRYASDALDHGMQYAYRDRKTKKRNYRALWQVRINAAVRSAGTTYSRFMEGLKAAHLAAANASAPKPWHAQTAAPSPVSRVHEPWRRVTDKPWQR